MLKIVVGIIRNPARAAISDDIVKYDKKYLNVLIWALSFFSAISFSLYNHSKYRLAGGEALIALAFSALFVYVLIKISVYLYCAVIIVTANHSINKEKLLKLLYPFVFVLFLFINIIRIIQYYLPHNAGLTLNILPDIWFSVCIFMILSKRLNHSTVRSVVAACVPFILYVPILFI
jgi:hypothetical protein